jgi:hypothetical protein
VDIAFVVEVVEKVVVDNIEVEVNEKVVDNIAMEVVNYIDILQTKKVVLLLV